MGLWSRNLDRFVIFVSVNIPPYYSAFPKFFTEILIFLWNKEGGGPRRKSTVLTVLDPCQNHTTEKIPLSFSEMSSGVMTRQKGI